MSHVDPIRSRHSRRDLLRAALAGTLTSAFLPRLARASPRPAPTNLVLVYHPNGLEVGWEPTGSRTEFSLGPVLAPLERHLDQVSILGGVRGGISNEVLAHNQGMVSLWTGSTIPAEAGFARHRSVDQLVADRIAAGAPFRSLEFGVQSLLEGVQNHTVMCYADAETPLPPDDDPDAVFNRVFAPATGDPKSAARLRAERASVLDLISERLEAVRAVYGAEDRARLDAHLEAVRGIERRLDGLSALTCDTSSYAPHGLSRADLLGNSAHFSDLAALQVELMAAALACGATRVASLQLSYSTSGTEIPGLGLPGIHTVMHAGTGPEKTQINTWFAGQLASLLDTFTRTPGAAGGSLLDETLVVWGTEMAVGNHLNERIPAILAGGGVFPGRRWHAFDAPPRHTRLLLSILHAFGIEDYESLGDFPDDRGPLEELWT